MLHETNDEKVPTLEKSLSCWYSDFASFTAELDLSDFANSSGRRTPSPFLSAASKIARSRCCRARGVSNASDFICSAMPGGVHRDWLVSAQK